MASTLAARMVAAIAPALGLSVHLDHLRGSSGQIQAPDGRRFYFSQNRFDLNPANASAVARDKARCAHYLRRMGYPVPEGRTFYSDAWCRRRRTRDDIAAGYRYARDYLGFPVVVKPNTGSFGAGVATVGNRRQFYRAMRTVFDELGGHVALVQRVAEGSDYRIAVLDDDVIAAYRRRPLSVTGDGRHTIMELCERKLDALSRQGRPLHIEPEDPRISCRLERMQLSPHHVLPGGTDVFLLDNANLSTGGDAVDVTEHIHPEFRGLAVRIARDIGLRFCGIDLVTSSSLQESPIGYTVLEVNAAPLFDHFVTLGEAQQRRVEAIYGRILQAMVNR